MTAPSIRRTPARQLTPTINQLINAAQNMARKTAVPAVRYGLALIMLWFGAPKLVPGGSPAEQLAIDTVGVLTGGLITGETARLMVGTLEVTLGLALLIGRAMPLVLLALAGHITATFTPLIIFPALTWHAPFIGSLEGQYILKNILIIAGLITLTGYGLKTTPHTPTQRTHTPKPTTTTTQPRPATTTQPSPATPPTPPRQAHLNINLWPTHTTAHHDLPRAVLLTPPSTTTDSRSN